MNVLVACEFSGVVREAFSKAGHYAVSCDFEDTEIPGEHYKGDVFDVLDYGWDLIIMHPPCRYITVSGNGTYSFGKPLHYLRLEAVKWTQNLWDKATKVCNRVCMENPVGQLNTLGDFPKPQYIHPWQFGHGETKKTGLWLHNLPPLIPTDIVPGREQRIWKMPPGEDRSKERSRTYQGIANAMASQWQ